MHPTQSTNSTQVTVPALKAVYWHFWLSQWPWLQQLKTWVTHFAGNFKEDVCLTALHCIGHLWCMDFCVWYPLQCGELKPIATTPKVKYHIVKKKCLMLCRNMKNKPYTNQDYYSFMKIILCTRYHNNTFKLRGST